MCIAGGGMHRPQLDEHAAAQALHPGHVGSGHAALWYVHTSIIPQHFVGFSPIPSMSSILYVVCSRFFSFVIISLLCLEHLLKSNSYRHLCEQHLNCLR